MRERRERERVSADRSSRAASNIFFVVQTESQKDLSVCTIVKNKDLNNYNSDKERECWLTAYPHSPIKVVGYKTRGELRS